MSENTTKKMCKEIWVTEFTEKSAQNFREQVLYTIENDSHKPILIYIDSYGGNVDSLVKMIDTMDEVPNTKITTCMGKAMSCGAILLSHGDIRFCSPYSRVLVHEISTFTWGDINDVQNTTEEGKRLNRRMMELLAKNCDIKGGYTGLRRKIKDNLGRDLYFDAEQALNFGIVDYLGTPKVSELKYYEISVENAPKPAITKTKSRARRKTVKKQIKKKEA